MLVKTLNYITQALTKRT